MSHQKLVEALKQSLKSRGLTYLDLAKKLKMSESGVKKLFLSSDISMGRLRELADILEISLTDLVRLSEEGRIEEVQLTLKQEEALVKEPALFRFYWKYTVEKVRAESFLKDYGFTNKDLQSYLKKLEQLGLRHHQSRLFRWTSDGPLLKKINREWSEMTLHRALLLGKADKTGCHHLVYYQLSEKSRTELLSRFDQLLEDFAHRSEREEMTLPQDTLKPVSVLLAVVPQSFVEKI